MQISAIIAANQKRWDTMKLSVDRIHAFDEIAHRLCANKDRYVAIAQMTKVLWFVIAVIHEREASGDFARQLGQGDPLNKKSFHDPAGRGPWYEYPGDTNLHNAFQRCAVDALCNCEPNASRWTDWTAGGTLTLLEEYNGLGYAIRGVPSAYVWSGTNQYVSGKFIADHVYRASAIDVQEGCAPIIARMMVLDPSISFARRIAT